MELIVNFENPAKIDFVNFEQLKTEITSKLEFYNNLVVSEDSVKEAKSDKAKLNSLVKAIEDKRKEYKKLCLEPYEDYERKCKELVNLIQQPIISIDTQIKNFDEIERKEKFAAIEAIYNNLIGDLKDIVTLGSILPVKWQNKTCSLEEIKAEINGTILNIRSGLLIIEDLKTNHILQAKDVFIKTRNLTSAIAEAKRLDELEEKLTSQQPKPVKAEAEHKQPETNENAPQSVSINSNAISHTDSEDAVTVDFRVTCTPSQLTKLGEYMRANGIKYGKA